MLGTAGGLNYKAELTREDFEYQKETDRFIELFLVLGFFFFMLHMAESKITARTSPLHMKALFWQ